MNAINAINALRAQRGFTSIEGLVSMVILVVVALGMAGMTAQASRQQKNAHHLYRATLLLSDLGERVRSAHASAVTGDFAAPLNYDSAVGAPGLDCFVAPCSAAQTAEFERQRWLQKVRADLPNGAASIAFAPQPAGQPASGLYTITLVWREVGSHAGPRAAKGAGGLGVNDPACAQVPGLPANQQARCFIARVGV